MRRLAIKDNQSKLFEKVSPTNIVLDITTKYGKPNE